MTDINKTGKSPKQSPRANKPVDSWTTGDEPVTAAQASYIETLAQEAGEKVDTKNMSKAEASRKIEELQHKTGREGEQVSKEKGD